MARSAMIWVGAFAVGLVAPSTSHASELCVIELIGYVHNYWYPPAGSCALATYEIAVDHCGNVWTDDWTATTTAYGGKWVSGPRTYDFSCVDGEVAWFGW
ncbi:MAG: hypothetical protein ABMB14_17520 [Myxococcota bacterium]